MADPVGVDSVSSGRNLSRPPLLHNLGINKSGLEVDLRSGAESGTSDAILSGEKGFGKEVHLVVG